MCLCFVDKEEDVVSVFLLLMVEKDWVENLMIVDLLCNDIFKYCVLYSVIVFLFFVLESYEVVYYLVSMVIGVFYDNVSFFKLFVLVFSGGFIIGVLKICVMEVIDELEIYCRNIYCGSMFYMGFREDFDLSICI